MEDVLLLYLAYFQLSWVGVSWPGGWLKKTDFNGSPIIEFDLALDLDLGSVKKTELFYIQANLKQSLK